jgi:excisionase family DNA binding protein
MTSKETADTVDVAVIAVNSTAAVISFVAFAWYLVPAYARKGGTTMSALDNLVHADPQETEEIELLRERIEEIFQREGKALLIGPDSDEEPVELPGSAFEALKFVVEAMSKGQTIVLMPRGRVLTTQEAADVLHVSRPHLVKLCDKGELAFERVGSHRRLKIEDVLEYREQRGQVRSTKLDELTRLSQQLPGGYR